jgi:hypothetical protein
MLIYIREQATLHNTRERTQPTNSNTHAPLEDPYAFENKTRSTGHNKREHNPATQTRMRIEGTYNTYIVTCIARQRLGKHIS